MGFRKNCNTYHNVVANSYCSLFLYLKALLLRFIVGGGKERTHSKVRSRSFFHKKTNPYEGTFNGGVLWEYQEGTF